MAISFSRLDMHDLPSLVLKNAGGRTIGVLGHAYGVSLELNYNEVSQLSFSYSEIADGEMTPYFDQLVEMRTIAIEDLGQYTLLEPEVSNDGIKRIKTCRAYSLEYEFTYKNITIPSDTYKFWDAIPERRSATVLGMIMDLMPGWRVGNVPISIVNKYRTFEISSENLYNFIKNTVQQTFECIFEFDTDTRTVDIRDANSDAASRPVYLSTENLAKQIDITADSENLVTRLDVNGAEGVSIRDVNPTGVNNIVNLEYFMTPDNFDVALIEKYHEWKALCAARRPTYYINSVSYTLLVMQLATEQARLTDMKGELTNLDNQRGVLLEAISKGLAQQAALDTLNNQYASQETAIGIQKTRIADLTTQKEAALTVLQATVQECSFAGYFTKAEQIELDRYIRDGDITDETFVSVTTMYTDTGTSTQFTGESLVIDDAQVTTTVTSNETIYDIRGGVLTISNTMEANIVSAVVSVKPGDGSVMLTAALGLGMIEGQEFSSGSLSITGSATGDSATETECTMTMTGYAYFTLNPSEYQKRSVAWDLYEYGESMAEKLSQPTYRFSVSSANFFAIDEFLMFKNRLRLGDKIYLNTGDRILKPVCVGVSFEFDNLSQLEMKFSDSYVQSDTAFKLADLLEQSVSMGRTVNAGKFNYEAFQRNGASVGIREFMTGALDVSKNAILSSSEQAISWDEAGLRLRRWEDNAHTTYEDEQIWMNNNSVLITDDGWQTAKMAIGKFHDGREDRDYWGILAPVVVGTLLAGENLIIESESNYDINKNILFRVDGDGCSMHNGFISVSGDAASVWEYRAKPDYTEDDPNDYTPVDVDDGDPDDTNLPDDDDDIIIDDDDNGGSSDGDDDDGDEIDPGDIDDEGDSDSDDDDGSVDVTVE